MTTNPPPFQFPQPPTLDLSIVIVNFNTRNIVLDCLKSIHTHTEGITFETLVVDNHSTDGSPEAIKNAFPKVTLIENKDNRGFSSANNQAIKIARGRYTVLLNSDTLLTENCFLKIVRYLDDHPEFALLSPQILDSSGAPCPMRLWEDSALDAALKILGRYDPASEFKKMGVQEPREVQAIGGSCFVMRRQLFESTGLFDENYFLYNEEDDFCRRARKLGHKICYFPEAHVKHLLGQSTHQPDIRAKVILETYKSNLYFYRKHYPGIRDFLLRSLYRLSFVAGIFRSLGDKITGRSSAVAEDSIALKLKLLFMRIPAPKKHPTS
ncbi:dTDP-Rha:A-D-GlcNAc-diphosphoryl polyprenol, A-3-L-rhamnosyl transferase WbbL [hydrothermal vent metagenome]|uniref:dTDP-Rha:A-D-GlcNAc-diphosphoryl polyprenol, A-3-L-rhamnosyl transferase WbbL n=1 Tax=hydrothermal vent metagenome TaxID=652676 RepID=A0A3B1D722_9ZZZZ